MAVTFQFEEWVVVVAHMIMTLKGTCFARVTSILSVYGVQDRERMLRVADKVNIEGEWWLRVERDGWPMEVNMDCDSFVEVNAYYRKWNQITLDDEKTLPLSVLTLYRAMIAEHGWHPRRRALDMGG